MSDNRKQILFQLSDGVMHSGTALAGQLNISRAAVWKHIKALRAEGVKIESDAGNGYRIPGGLQLLDSAVIESELAIDISENVCLQMLDITPSTNDWLLGQLPAGLDSDRWPRYPGQAMAVALRHQSLYLALLAL